MNSKISELNTNAVAGEGVNVAVDGGDVQSENYLRGYNTLHYVNISPADTRFERGMSDLGRRMPDLGRRMPDFEIVQNLQPTRRYRIKRQQPGCCSRCNAQYGGACDPGASCAGCNACGCCDRPRIIYRKGSQDDNIFESPRNHKKKGCC